MNTNTIVIKLGGALLTDKSRPFALRYDVLKRIAKEIAEAYTRCNRRIIVIHGGGSYGHYVVSEYGHINSREAITQTIWFMRELNMSIVDAFLSFGVPAVPFDTHAIAIIKDGDVYINCESIANALQLEIVPVIYGDVVLGKNAVKIISGDEIAWYLSREFKPSRLLFATIVDGVYDKDPSERDAKLLEVIRLRDIESLSLGIAQGFDVTGGMKLKLVLGLKYGTKDINEVLIFNGLKERQIYAAICGFHVCGSKVLLY